MTAQTATMMKRIPNEAVRPSNLIRTLSSQFRTIRPIEKTELPISRGRNRASMHQLQVVKEFNELLDHINKNNLNPCEIVGELDVSGEDAAAERKKRKSFPQSFRKLLRQIVKDHNLQKQVEVMEFNKGERFFIVGRAA